MADEQIIKAELDRIFSQTKTKRRFNNQKAMIFLGIILILIIFAVGYDDNTTLPIQNVDNEPIPIPVDIQPVSITKTDPEIHIGFFGCAWRQTKAAPKKTMEKI